MKKIDYSLFKILNEKEIKEEFIKKLSIIFSNLCKILNVFLSKRTLPTREISFTLMKEIEKIETFLDDYGASHNRTFFYFRELIASIRWLNIALFHSLHIFARIENYELQIKKNEKEKFIKELETNTRFYFSCIKNLIKELKKEAGKLGIEVHNEKFSEELVLPKIQKKILPPDLNTNSGTNGGNQIFNFLVKFLEESEKVNFLVCKKIYPEEVTEENLEKFRSIFHQLESMYDTFIIKTEIEKKTKYLITFRGYIALILHLLEIGRALTHFYERHSDEVRKYKTAIKITKIVDKEKIKEIVKNFILFYSLFFISKGKSLSYKIFKSLGTEAEEFIIQTVVLLIPTHRIEDFHIRPIMPITQIANKYKFDTYLYFQRKKYNLKNAIEVAIAIPDIRDFLVNKDVELVVQGPEKAVKEICEFLKEKCGAQIQPECETFPLSLKISLDTSL